MPRKIFANMSEDELVREIHALKEQEDTELVEEIRQAEDKQRRKK